MHKNIQDWYLECYYGFDVMFTPTDFNNAKTYDSITISKGPSEGMRDKKDIVEVANVN